MSGRSGEGTVSGDGGRLLGIDYGSKRIGLAVSDPDGRVAVVLETFARSDDRRAARYVARVAAREGVAGLVLGEPRRLDGTRGEAAERVTRFARRLEATTGLPVTLVDESLTSVEAERRLRAAGVDPAADPGRVDAVAAQILLQEVLDRRRV
ncbi:MAG TPA: Holliday junction resolvase RuvX [Thermoanaerobaculia bacterium]|nr:Holliday junction resolvase RuvX [Thermoanaerobaculia bacterium]